MYTQADTHQSTNMAQCCYCSDPTRKKRIVTLTDTHPKRTHESADCQARFDTPRVYWHLELLSSLIFEKSQTVTFESQASNKECLDLLIVIWRELMFGPSLVLKKEKNFTRKETLSELTISRLSSATWYTQALLLNTKLWMMIHVWWSTEKTRSVRQRFSTEVTTAPSWTSTGKIGRNHQDKACAWTFSKPISRVQQRESTFNWLPVMCTPLDRGVIEEHFHQVTCLRSLFVELQYTPGKTPGEAAGTVTCSTKRSVRGGDGVSCE